MISGRIYPFDETADNDAIHFTCLQRFPIPQPLYKRFSKRQSRSIPLDNTCTGRYDSAWFCFGADGRVRSGRTQEPKEIRRQVLLCH